MTADTKALVIAVALIFALALAGVRIVDWVKGPVISSCAITVSDPAGNRHVFIGKGEVWR